jgi:NAD(P)-dependent dehydrogenase (short-subunit alcohol dehydrogenase family)
VIAKAALIVGAGGVLGEAIGRELLSAGYAVVGLRRNGSAASRNAGYRIESCDLQDPVEVQRIGTRVVAELGRIDVLICNAARLVVAPFTELTAADFERVWRVGVRSATGAVQAVLPTMINQGCGAIIFTGATASTRGTARFAAFASAKFALRGLAQSLAREYQTQGIHVVHVVLDGLLRGSASQTRFGADSDKCLDPDQVAKTYRWLAEQHPLSWTHEIDIRPSSEKF